MHRILFLTLVIALACGAPGSGVGDISQDELLSQRGELLVLDVRSSGEYGSGHVPNAVNIPYDQLDGRLSEIDEFRESTVVVYCESGRRAGRATELLTDAGFVQVRHLEGDMAAWREQARPTERPDAR